MIFNELLYPIFLAICVFVFHMLPSKFKPWWLFTCGTAFYAYYAEIFIILLIIEILLVYLLSKNMKKNIPVLIISLIISVGVLAYFKYKNMFLTTLWELFSIFTGSQLPTFEKMVFPLAISFFTFEFVHYIIDSYKGKIPQHNFKEFLAFIMFFPTMVAGPIKRFQDFVPKMNNASFSFAHLNAGIYRILIGLFKKIVIADSMDLWMQPVLSVAGISSSSSLDLWIALFAYSVKIYVDFSGYSDIAIGSARLFGIVIPENFLSPYLKPNISKFWKSWHISLTKWIIDYVFIPIGGSRGTFRRVAFNTIAAMSVSGLWHGAYWHFVVWGIYHGVLLVSYRFYSEKLKPRMKFLEKIPNCIGHPAAVIFTFILVNIGWGLFILPMDIFTMLLPRLMFLQ